MYFPMTEELLTVLVTKTAITQNASQISTLHATLLATDEDEPLRPVLQWLFWHRSYIIESDASFCFNTPLYCCH